MGMIQIYQALKADRGRARAARRHPSGLRRGRHPMVRQRTTAHQYPTYFENCWVLCSVADSSFNPLIVAASLLLQSVLQRRGRLIFSASSKYSPTHSECTQLFNYNNDSIAQQLPIDNPPYSWDTFWGKCAAPPCTLCPSSFIHRAKRRM